MALNVISNFAANVAHRNLSRSDMEMTDSMSKLSSGTRVVSAKDDAASLAIGSRLQAEVSALRQAQVNAGQGVSMLQVADGAMARAHDILMRMKTLAVQAGSGQLSGTERSMLNTEYQQLVSEIERLAQDTEFNGNQLVNGAIVVDRSSAADFSTNDGMVSLTFRGSFDTASDATISYDTSGAISVAHDGFTYGGTIDSAVHDGSTMSMGTVITLIDTGGTSTNKIDIVLDNTWDVDAAHTDGTLDLSGTSTASFSFKVGTGNSATADELSVSINGIGEVALGIDGTNVTSEDFADTASVAISLAVDTLNDARAELGAAQNRLEFAAANIATTLENTEAARSNLLDLDIASEMSRLTSKQILVQAGVAMLAQANQAPQNLLRLFQQ